MVYKVKIDVFEGPFDLLVYLIEHAEMSIYDIKIAEITEQYLAYMETMRHLDVEVAGEFMVLASTLIEIKSRMLLPRYKPDGVTGLVAEDPRAELVEKILEYKKFKAVSEMLEYRQDYAQLHLSKPQEDLVAYTRTDEEYLDLGMSQFMKAFHMFLLKKKKVEEIHKRYGEIKRERISVDDKISHTRRLLQNKGDFSFDMLIDDPEDRQEIIAAFMAVLELLRRREIIVRQLVSFGSIHVSMAPAPIEQAHMIEGGKHFVQ